MNYYDNGPFLKSLENGSSASNNTALIVGLVIGLVIVSGIAVVQANQLKEGRIQVAELRKMIDAVKAEKEKILATVATISSVDGNGATSGSSTHAT